MRKKLILIPLVLSLCLILSSCGIENKTSSFTIDFIDVGQGDAALVACDGEYMLIDSGDDSHGETVYNYLHDKGANHLKLLVLSHLHADHIGGLTRVLQYVLTIDTTLCNQDSAETVIFKDVEKELTINDAQIKVPSVGEKYSLGSADVEVLAVGDGSNDNDSLVILITYGKTTFLFTGDMEEKMERALCDSLGDNFPVTLLKVAHHGSNTSSSIRFLRMTMPQYAIISVGKNNGEGHPSNDIIDRFNDLKKSNNCKLYRTDEDGNITVTSNGSSLQIITSK